VPTTAETTTAHSPTTAAWHLRPYGDPYAFKVRGKGGKVVLVPLPPAVARAIDPAVEER
jgi:hypothetical protein